MSVMKPASSWVMLPPHAATAGSRLYCFPYAGGGTWIFRDWSRLLGTDIAVCPLKLPGRADRLGEPAATDLHELADTLVQQLGPHLQTPYAFFGCSMGAILAYECITRILAHKAPPPALFFVASAPAPANVVIQQPLHHLADQAFLAAVQREYRNPMMATLADEMLPLVLPALRGDITMYETYQARNSQPPLPCSLQLIHGDQDPIPETAFHAWQSYTSGPFDRHVLPGGHFIVLDQQPRVLDLVRNAMAAALRP